MRGQGTALGRVTHPWDRATMGIASHVHTKQRSVWLGMAGHLDALLAEMRICLVRPFHHVLSLGPVVYAGCLEADSLRDFFKECVCSTEIPRG